MNIVVTGAKSSGKTTVGKILAKRLDIPFVDLDDLVLDYANKDRSGFATCADIYRAVGERAFRDMERKVISGMDRQGYFVLATGGSTLLEPESRRLLRPGSLWFYLKASDRFLWRRLSRRPLPAYLDEAEDAWQSFSWRVAAIDEILAYHSDRQIDAEREDVSQIADEIVAALCHEFAARTDSPNTIGEVIRLTTFGESHGPMLGAVLDGVRPGLPLSASDIQAELDRRRPGQSALSTDRKEGDCVQIVSGVFAGKTTGTPVGMLIPNSDSRSSHYEAIRDLFRPGHADYTFWQKYGIRDHRGGGRSSGRETASRVAGGAVARKLLRERGVSIRAYTIQVGRIKVEQIDYDEIERNAVRCPDAAAAHEMAEAILEAKKNGDSLGGVVQIEVHGVPAGVGDPVFAKLDAKLAAAIFSIGAVKGVEFGAGFTSAKMSGRQNNDEIEDGEFLSNNAGGILGGISTGQPIIARLAVKPTPSVSTAQRTMDTQGNNREIRIEGRHDPCIAPRVVPVVESMVALTLLDVWAIQDRLRPAGGQ